MFSCKESIDLLLDYLEGEMSEAEQRHLEEHLQACPPCVDFLKTYKATPVLCRKALESKMPAELSERLTDFIRAKAPKGR